MTRRQPHAFTLIEISAVLAIIGILAAIAVFGGRLFVERSRDDALLSELDALWEQTRSDAIANDTSPRAVLTDHLDALNRRSDRTYATMSIDPSGMFVPDPAGTIILGTEPDVDGLPCAMMQLPRSPDVERAPAGPCDGAASSAIGELTPGGWWQLDEDDIGALTADAETGPDAAATSLTFMQPPALAHHYDPDSPTTGPDGLPAGTGADPDGQHWAARVVSGGRLTATDTEAITDPADGLTMALWARFPSTPTTGTIMQVGDAADLRFQLGFDTGTPMCSMGDPSDPGHRTAVAGDTFDNLVDEPDDWHLIACRVDPSDSTVSVLIDGIEFARSPARTVDGDDPLDALFTAGSWGTPTIHPIGGTGSLSDWFADEPAFYGSALADSTLAALHGLSRAPDTAP